RGELAVLAHLALANALEVELVLDDVWREQDEQVHLAALARRVLEQVAEQRDVAEQRHLRRGVDLALLDQTADDHALLIVDDDLRLQLALCPRRAELGVDAAEVLRL